VKPQIGAKNTKCAPDTHLAGLALTTRAQELEEALYKFDQTSFADANRDGLLKKAFKLFQTHSRKEEKNVLHKLESKLTQELNHSLALDFLQARKAAPHRPHIRSFSF
jgi:hypothetical protein